MDLVDQLGSLIFSTLITTDSQGRLVGDLATQVPTVANGGISADGMTYTYHLQHGVTWHDGVPLTSRDVKFSWTAVMNPRNNIEHREGYDQVASIATPDDHTVVVHLRRRDPPFVTQFFTAIQEGPKGILPEHLLGTLPSINNAAFNSAPIGSGPFRFERWERGQRVVLVRNAHYFRGVPKLRAIDLLIYPNDSTLLNQVRTHALDLVMLTQYAQYEQYRALPDVTVTTEPTNMQAILTIDDRRPILHDPVIRRAIAMSIDYDAIIKKLTHGVAERAHDILPPPAIGYTDLPAYRYDLSGARALLDRAGWKVGPDGIRAKNGEKLDFTFSGTTGSASTTQLEVLLQEQLRAAGINLSIRNYSYTQLYAPDGPLWRGTYDLVSYAYTQPLDPDNHFYLGCDQWTPHGMNNHFFCDPKVDEFESEGLQTNDPAQRGATYHRAERLIYDDVPYVPLYQLRRIVVRSVDIKNFQSNPSIIPWYEIWKTDV